MTTAAQARAQANRGTIFVEEGDLLSSERYPGDQFILRIRAPRTAQHAAPGSFVHVSCADELPMRRPLSIMRVGDGWIEVLFKTGGQGLHLLSQKQPGDTINLLGPIGKPFRFSKQRPRPLLIGGGVGIPPMVYIADELRSSQTDWYPLAILGSEIPFPFELQRSGIETPWLDAGIDSTMPLLEEWGIPCRLATLSGFDGCFDGYVTDLAERWLSSLSETERSEVEVYACGPTPMLKAVAAVADRYRLPCQVSLEEFMACAVGGCAGCAVEVMGDDGPAMKRVCVDGPVFDAATVVW